MLSNEITEIGVLAITVRNDEYQDESIQRIKRSLLLLQTADFSFNESVTLIMPKDFCF